MMPVTGLLVLAVVGVVLILAVLGLIVLLARGRVLAAVVTGAAFLVGLMVLFLWAAVPAFVVVRQDGPATYMDEVTSTLWPTTPSTIVVSPGDSPSARPPARPAETASTPDPEPAKLPEWVSQPEATRDGITTLVLSSQRFVTQEEAEEQLTAELVNRARQYFHDEHPNRGPWTLPPDEAVRSAVKQRHVEIIPKKFGGDMTVAMKRIRWQVQLSPEIRRDLYPLWRKQVVEQRLIQLGGGVGFATFLLLTGMTYFRVDARTQGAYRGWLRFAALSIATAGGAAAWLVV